MGIRDRLRHWVYPKMDFVENNLIEIREIVDAARELQDFPTRERDRMTLRVSAERLDRAMRQFMQGMRARKERRLGAPASGRRAPDLTWMNGIANEIITHLEILKRFVEEFQGDEGRMTRMKKKAERDFVGKAIRGARGRFAEGTTFKQYLDQDK